MSGLKRTEDLHTLKTKQLVMQNPGGSFPLVGSVLAFEDSRGHVVPAVNLDISSIVVGDLNANTIEVNDLHANTIESNTLSTGVLTASQGPFTVDVAGNIVAKTITVGEGILNKAAVISNGSDIVINSANLYVTGDQNLTGSVQAAYITLPAPVNAQADTYVWANSNQLLWEDISANVLNISQAVINQSVGPTIPAPSDLSGCITALTALLDLFNSRGIFIITAPPVVPTINFNTSCSIQFNIYNSSGVLVTPPIPSYTASGSILLTTLCTDITTALGVYGSMNYSPTLLTATLVPANGYSIGIADVNSIGEATRFINHLGFTGSLIVTGTRYTLPVTGNSFIANTPNNDSALLWPVTPLVVSAISSGSALITITAPTGPLTAPNVLQYYGIYLNGTALSNAVDLSPSSSTTYTITFPPSLTPQPQTVNVFALDWYNQSVVAPITFVPAPLPMPWPPAGFVNGYSINGVKTPASGDFLSPLVPYQQVGPSINNTYTFTIIPSIDLVNICMRINVDDGTVITFTGLQPTGAPNPLVNIPGPQPSYGSGGALQYSQPITLTANTQYTINMTYYNAQSSTCLFTLGYVVPTGANPWSPGAPGQNPYSCPALDPLVQQNLSQYCFIQSP